MTMVPTILFPDRIIDFLDGSYWTLAIEMKFYAVVLLFLLFKQFKKIEKVSLVVAPIMLLSALFLNISVESQLVWIPNFIAGIVFYKIYREGLTPWRIFGLANTFAASLIFTVQRIPFLEGGYGVDFSAITISAYVFISYIIFLFISLDKIKVSNSKIVNTLGLLTYPVYLLHQQIARILFTLASEKNIPLYISFPGMLVLIIGMSYAVHVLFERRGKLALDRLLDKVTPSSLKRL
jgi:peptidoglycan/LPS O-acetylase OafA/YrhL